jgi:hypothetical protein
MSAVDQIETAVGEDHRLAPEAEAVPDLFEMGKVLDLRVSHLIALRTVTRIKR